MKKSYYYDYIKGLCPESDDWVINQICGELDSRDYALALEKRNAEAERISGSSVVKMLEDYKAAMESYFGKSKCLEAQEQYKNN